MKIMQHSKERIGKLISFNGGPTKNTAAITEKQIKINIFNVG